MKKEKKNEIKFFRCRHCGNIITLVQESGAPVSCCGEHMSLLTPNTVEASGEKHVPAVTINGSRVSVVVGSVEHPMVEEHFIQWICLETDKGFQMKNLAPNTKPFAEFELVDGTPIAVYEYCNLHSLWKVDL